MRVYLWVAFLRGIILYSSGNQRLQVLEVRKGSNIRIWKKQHLHIRPPKWPFAVEFTVIDGAYQKNKYKGEESINTQNAF